MELVVQGTVIPFYFSFLYQHNGSLTKSWVIRLLHERHCLLITDLRSSNFFLCIEKNLHRNLFAERQKWGRLRWKGRCGGTGRRRGRETITRIYYVRKKNVFFNKRKIKNMVSASLAFIFLSRENSRMLVHSDPLT